MVTRINQEVAVQFSRGRMYDRYDLSGLIDQDRVFNQLSLALFSTAITPPLDNEWLVG